MTDTLTAPAVTFTAVRARNDRNVRAEHVIEDVEHGHLLVVLSSTHNVDRKRYEAIMTRMTRTDVPGSGFVSEKYRPMEDSVRVTHDVTARYSAKGLAAFHAYALDTLAALIREEHPEDDFLNDAETSAMAHLVARALAMRETGRAPAPPPDLST